MSNAALLGNVQTARGVAAAMVVLQHALAQTYNHPVPGIGRTMLLNETSFGNGVDIFFIISGFIMVYITAGRQSDEVRPGTFFLRRFLRVAPLYWLFTLLMIVATLASPGSVNKGLGSTWHVVSSFLFVPSPRPDGMLHPVLGLGWTLNYEFFFYSCFAVALFASARIAPIVVGGLFVVLALLHPLMPAGPLSFWTNPIIVEFALGMALARFFLARPRLPVVGVLAVGAVGVLTTFAFPMLIPDAPRLVVSGLPSFLVVAAFVLAPQRNWSGPVTGIGNASYAIYLSHPFALNLGTAVWRKAHLPAVAWLYVGFLVLLSLVVGYAVHRLVELPIEGQARRLRRRIERRDRAPAPAETGSAPAL